MISSMTGFGRAQGIVGNKKIIVEVKSVNSKGLDLGTKLPSLYREKDILIRKLVGAKLQRGKAECSIYYDVLEEESHTRINHNLVDEYANELKSIKERTGMDSSDMLGTIMRMPDVYKSERTELSDEEWSGVSKLIDEAVETMIKFRQSEGKVLADDFKARVANIEALLGQIAPHEEERIKNVRERILNNMSDMDVSADESRLEQELVYYLEKLDVTEEKVRLKAHCDYFIQTMNNKESSGKKLGFIAQEMGREINTLGSKANHAEIQRIVVQMKDELEKIKEQVLNVL